MTYQLSCGHWQSDQDDYGIGGVFICLRHGRVVVIGMSTGVMPWGLRAPVQWPSGTVSGSDGFGVSGGQESREARFCARR